jgi:ribosome maturation factor RimP
MLGAELSRRFGRRSGERARARFFHDVNSVETMSGSFQQEIEARLAEREPDVEVLLAEVLRGALVRLFIDHPEGVTLSLCERVTDHLAPLRERYALEVSSPGRSRPLTKPDHFRRFLGRRARVRTRRPRDGHRSFTGELVGAGDGAVTIAADTGVVSIPYADILRSNLVPGE